MMSKVPHDPTGRRMSTPHQEIKCFLASCGTDPDAALAVAMEFARRMCEELRMTLAQWELEMEALEDTKAIAASAVEN